MKKPISFAIFYCIVFTLHAQTILWTEEFPGVWKGTFGKPDAYNLFSAVTFTPNGEAIKKLPQQEFPLNKPDIQAEIIAGKTYLRFPLQKDEQIYGLGLNFQTVHQRGKILTLHVDHYGGKDNGRTHAPVPFYVSSNGYGVFVNSAQYLTFYVGTAVRKDSKNPPAVKDRNTDKAWSARPYSDAVEVLIPAEGIEFYVFAGPTALDAVRRYNLYCGGGCLPPRWGLGFTQRVQKLYTAEQVEQEAEAFEKNGYPLDFIGLEPGWQSKAYPCAFEWDKTRFPDPAGFTKRLLDKGIRLNLWTNPYISPEASIYKSIEPFTGSHTVWTGAVPDLHHPQARQILAAQFNKDQVQIGISGYKIDEVDGYDYYLWPDVAKFPSGISAIQMRQTYGVLAQQLTDELYRKINKRTFGLVRASNAGANNLPYVIYNDYYSHEDFITALINSSFCGTLWTPEVRSSKTAEEWLRRFQSVVFSPMAMINAWSSGTQPWSFPEVAEQVKYYALLRMQLMPYFYSEFAKYHFEGTPPFRAMALESGFSYDAKTVAGSQNLDENPYLEAVRKEVKDQYMAGEYLLIAPLFTGQTSRKVILPQGKWYDFYTGKYAGNGEEITVNPGLDRIPVFVKDGGIIPMTDARLHTPATGEIINLEIRHYGEKEGKYKLYDDDGETFDYEKGMYSWREITFTKDKQGKLQGSISKAEKEKPDNLGKVTFRMMPQENTSCKTVAFTDYSGGKVYVMENGKIVWQHDAPDSNDLWALPNGNILFTTGKGVLEMTRQNDTVFHYSSACSVYACQRLKNGNTFVAESDLGRLLEIAPNGKIVKSVCILPEGVSNAGYAFMRNARKLDNGHYLVAHYKDQCVKEYDANGKMVWEVKTPGGAHSVVRLPDGHTLVAVADSKLPDGSKNPRIVEFDKKGNIVWEFSNNDILDKPLRFMTGFQYFSDGRLLLTNWTGHEKSPENVTHLLLINRQKEILCRIGFIDGIKTMSSVYSLEKQKGGIKVYH